MVGRCGVLAGVPGDSASMCMAERMFFCTLGFQCWGEFNIPKAILRAPSQPPRALSKRRCSSCSRPKQAANVARAWPDGKEIEGPTWPFSGPKVVHKIWECLEDMTPMEYQHHTDTITNAPRLAWLACCSFGSARLLPSLIHPSLCDAP